VRQFDVCPNPSERSRAYAPFVVVLQSHLIEAIPTVVVAPMLLAASHKAYTQVSALVSFQGEQYIVSAAELVATDAKRLSASIGTLRDQEDAIRRALERLFTGF
jgi:toxin CcdB